MVTYFTHFTYFTFFITRPRFYVDSFYFQFIGLLSLRLKDEANIEENIADAMYVATNALTRLQGEKKLTEQPPSSCDEPSGRWNTGTVLYE